MRSVTEGSFLLVANGATDSPPMSGVRDWLIRTGAQVRTVHHPLGPEQEGRHVVTDYRDGRAGRRTVRLPSRPPLTYPLDLLVPPLLGRADVGIAFNNLHCARLLAARAAGRIDRVAYWAVDFVPDRFGPGRLTTAYDALDRWCCRASDVRYEVSVAALEARDARLGLASGSRAPARVSPIGAWLDRVPTTPSDGYRSRRIVFIGHIVERMGLGTAIDALELLIGRGVDVWLDVAGAGPLEAELRERVSASSLAEHVTWHGFISDHEHLERLLAGAAIALAPYRTDVESFTRFADPSKLKSYAAAGLPILTTDVPPNAHDLAAHGGASVVDDSPAAFADAVQTLLEDPAQWTRRRDAALTYIRAYDWATVVPEALSLLDWGP